MGPHNVSTPAYLRATWSLDSLSYFTVRCWHRQLCTWLIYALDRIHWSILRGMWRIGWRLLGSSLGILLTSVTLVQDLSVGKPENAEAIIITLARDFWSLLYFCRIKMGTYNIYSLDLNSWWYSIIPSGSLGVLTWEDFIRCTPKRSTQEVYSDLDFPV